MKDDRLRIAVADDYVAALGRAAYVFAWSEWAAVYCCERMEPGFAGRAAALTSGQIANRLVNLAKFRSEDASDRQRCLAAALEFKRLTRRRNDLVHANPGAALDGAQQLFRHGASWTVQAVNDVADEFAAGGIELNDLYHNVLK